MKDINWLWKNTPTPEIDALVNGIIENRFDREYENFDDDIAEALFFAFKAGYDTAA